MEHTLNRQTTTILTYINQGRRPAVPSPFPLARPSRRRARAGACGARRATLRVRRGPCPSASVRAGGASPLPQDGWTDREGMNEYE